MKRSVQFLGIAGIVLLTFGLLLWLLLSSDQWYFTPLHIITGLLFIGAFLVQGGLEQLQSSSARRGAGFGASVTIYSALFVGVVVIANYVASRHEFWHFDSTEQKVFTLSPQTVKVLDGLQTPVVMRGFFLGGRIDPQAEDLIKRMTRHSEKLRWVMIDPEKKPELAERYGVSQSETIHFSFDEESGAREVKITRDISEQEIVNAILKLTRGGEKTVYYVKGHGEPDLADATEEGYLFLKEAIHGENLRLQELALSESHEVPADAAALLVAAPRRDLLPDEFEAIRRYLERGGNALFLHEPRRSSDIAELVAPLGIRVGNDVIVDQVVHLFAGPGLGVQPMVLDYPPHPITRDFTEGTIFSIASSISPADEQPLGKVTAIARTSPQSWAETSVEKIFSETPEAALESGDIAGPVPIAVAYESDKTRDAAAPEGAEESGSDVEAAEAAKQSKARVVVIGDADFVTNASIRQLFNRDFFLNSLNWVIGEEQQLTIRPKSLRESTKGITQEQFSLMFLLTGVVLPEAVLLMGLAAWWGRRS